MTATVVTIAFSASAGAAFAFWTSSGEFSANASLTTLQPTIIESAVAGSQSVTLTWAKVNPPGSGTVEYYVSRDGGPASGNCPSAGARSTATTCTDTGVAVGTHSYTVTSVWRSWSAMSAEKSVTVGAGAVTHFVLEAGSLTPTAGEPDNLMVVAKNASNNTVTTYSGSHTLVFGGASAAPNGLEPTIGNEAGTAVKFGQATAIKFVEGRASVVGVTNGIMRLYRAGAFHITVSEGTLNNGVGLAVTVKTGPFKSFGVTPNPAEPQAGQAFEVKLAAWDEFHNLVTTYARTHKLRYEGAEASPSGKAPEYSTSTEPNFAGGEATVTGFRFYKAASTNLKVTEETTGHEGTGAFTVKALAPKTLSLTAAATEVASGQADALTITALDEFLNPATSYGGAGGETKNLTFEGAGASPNGSEPTVSNEAGAAVNFATATAIRFTNGKASVSGTANGVLTLYKVEEAHVKVKAGALNNGAGLAIKVKAGEAKSFKLSAPAPAEPEVGQAFNFTLTALDAGGNVATTYGGAAGQNKTIAYTGPLASPSGKAPEYPTTATTVNFKEGVGAANGIKLYRSGATTLTAKEGAVEGSVGFTVKAGRAASLLLIFNPVQAQVGVGDDLTIQALDTYGNVATSYANGSHSLTFSGAANGVNGTAPTVTEGTGRVRAFGRRTRINFTAGEAKVEAGRNGLMMLYHPEEAHVRVTGGGLNNGANGQPIVVVAGPAASFRVSASTPAEPEAGQALSVTFTALDAGGDLATTYGGAAGENKTLEYAGPEASPSGKAPEYPSTATTVKFKNGVGTATGIKLFAAAETTLTAKQGAVEGAVALTVKAGTFKGFGVTPEAAEPQVGQAFEVTIAAWDEFHNVVTTYRRTHRLHYSGAEASPSGRAPEYSGTTEPTFTAGETTVGGFRFYKSGSTTLKVAEETTTHEGAGTFTVRPGPFRSFNVVLVEPVLILPGALAIGAAPQALEAGPFEPLAGEDFEAKITAWDEFHNPVTTYTRTRRLRYQGAENSPSGRAPEYSGTTEPTFTAGETTVGGFRFFKAASTTLRVTEEGTGHEGSATFTVTPAGAAALSISASPAEATVGVGDELTITALDPYGNLATGYGEGAHALKFAGAGNGASGKQPVVVDRSGAEEAFGQATEINFTGGEAKVEGGRNGLMRLFKAEEAHLTVTDGTISNGAGLAIKVKGGAPTTFKLSAPAPAEPEVNQAFNITITAFDAGGNVATGYGAGGGENKTLAYSGPEASPSGKAPEYPASATTVHFKEGVGNANGIRLYRAGATTLTAKEGTVEGSVGLTVVAGQAASFKLSAPTPAEPGVGQATSVTLTALDGYGNLAPSYGGAVGQNKTIAYSGPEASPSGKAPEYPASATTVNFKEGIGTATGIKLYRSGANTLTAKEGAREGAVGFQVKAGPFKSFGVTPIPAEPQAGVAFEVKLAAWDEFHNPIATYARTHKLVYAGAENAVNGKAPEYAASTEPTFAGGEATLTGFRFYKAAATTLKVSEEATGHEGQATFTVKPGPAASFKLSAPAPAEPEVNQAFNITITAFDAGGNVATGYGAGGGENKTLAYSGPEASPSGKAPEYPASATTVHFKEGVGNANGIRLYRAGATTLTAKEGTVEGSVGLTVVAGQAASFKLSAPTPAEPGVGQATSVTLTALDGYGNLAPSYGGAVGQNKTIAYSGPEASPSGKAPEYPASATTVNFKEGIGTATGIKLYRSGANTLTAKEGAREGAVGFQVKAGPFKSFGVTPIPAEPQAGVAFEVKLAAWDEFHNPIATYARTHKLVYAGAENAVNGKAPEYAASTEPTFAGGEATLTGFRFYKAAATTLKVSEEATGHEGQATFTVKPGPAASFKLSAPAPAEPEVNQAFNITITAFDAGGNVATGYGAGGGENKTLAYSGPEASPSGKAPEYPASATTVHFKEGVGNANGIRLYRAGATTLTAKEGTVEGSVGLTVKAGAAKNLSWHETTVSAGTLSNPCSLTCTAEGVGSEGKFTSKAAITDEWGNLQASHGAAINVGLTSRLLVGHNFGGGFSVATVTIPAGATTSAGFTFTATRLQPPPFPTYEYALEASAAGYTGAHAATATLKS